jgi:hypothetical protein
LGIAFHKAPSFKVTSPTNVLLFGVFETVNVPLVPFPTVVVPLIVKVNPPALKADPSPISRFPVVVSVFPVVNELVPVSEILPPTVKTLAVVAVALPDIERFPLTVAIPVRIFVPEFDKVRFL